MIGIVDIRSLGYYKIKQGILQQNLSKYYRFEEASKLCKYFNRFIDTLKKDREQTTLVDKHPWLSPDDERRNMIDREILEKYIDLGASCLNKEERLKVMDMLYKYKEAFSLRDEIGTCPNRGGHRSHRQVTIFYQTISCEGRGQRIYRQRNEKIMLYGYSEGRIFSLF